MNQMDRLPKVSVVMPTYNRLALLAGAIDSVKGQTMPDWELIAVNDGSSDGTEAFLVDVARQDRRIRHCSNDHPKGPGGARNVGIAKARSDIIAFLDSDDRWLPQKLERALARFAQDPDAGILATDYWRLDGAGRQRGSAHMLEHLARWDAAPVFARARAALEVRRASDIEQVDVLVFALIAGCSWLQTSSILTRRSALVSAGAFAEGLQRCEDLELWLRLAEQSKLITLDEPLAEYRVDGQDVMHGPRYANDPEGRYGDLAVEHRHHIRFLQRLARQRALSTELRGCWRHRLGSLHRQVGVMLLGRRAPLRALNHLGLATWHRPKDLVLLLLDPQSYFKLPG